MKKYILIFFIALFLFPATVLAVDTTEKAETNVETNLKTRLEEQRKQRQEKIDEQKKKLDELKTERQALKTSSIEEECANVTERVNLEIAKFEGNREKVVANYQTAVTNVQNLLDTLELAGKDTLELENALKDLNTKILDLGDLYLELYEKLNLSTEIACGRSEGEYATIIKESRDIIKQIKMKNVEIRNYYTQTLKPIIKAIKTN